MNPFYSYKLALWDTFRIFKNTQAHMKPLSQYLIYTCTWRPSSHSDFKSKREMLTWKRVCCCKKPNASGLQKIRTHMREPNTSLELPPSPVAVVVTVFSVPVSLRSLCQCSPYCINKAGIPQTSLCTALQDETCGLSCCLILSEAINPQRSPNSKLSLYWKKKITFKFTW